jgi:hypothetical protein
MAWVSALFINSTPAHAAVAGNWELSAGLSFDSSDYGNGDFAWTRRWGASVGYYLLDLTELEYSFEDVTERTSIAGFEDTTFHDMINSLDVVQHFFDKSSAIQPYLKFGVGELNRTASGTYYGFIAPPSELDELTVIAGAGLKLYLTHNFALRGEATTYLTGGSISTWQDNFAITVGFSWLF